MLATNTTFVQVYLKFLGCLLRRNMERYFNLFSSQDKRKAAPVKQSDVKRTRRDRGELEDIMFKLFETQPNWALKQLVQETDQPAVSQLII